MRLPPFRWRLLRATLHEPEYTDVLALSTGLTTTAGSPLNFSYASGGGRRRLVPGRRGDPVALDLPAPADIETV